MAEKQNAADSHRLTRLAEKMHNKEYRDGYVATHTRQVLAKQMREFRGAMPQTDFAEVIGKRQTMVWRLENPNYSGWTLRTLFEIASRLNVAVFARFVDFPTFLKLTGDQSNNAMHPVDYNQQSVDDFACVETERELAQEQSIDASANVFGINNIFNAADIIKGASYEFNRVVMPLAPSNREWGASLLTKILKPADEVIRLKREIEAKDKKIEQLEARLNQQETHTDPFRPYDAPAHPEFQISGFDQSSQGRQL